MEAAPDSHWSSVVYAIERIKLLEFIPVLIKNMKLIRLHYSPDMYIPTETEAKKWIENYFEGFELCKNVRLIADRMRIIEDTCPQFYTISNCAMYHFRRRTVLNEDIITW